MPYSFGFFGLPNSGKSTMGLSLPGKVRHWIFGSSEETTEQNFRERTDITPVKFDWMDTLKPDTQKKFLVDPLLMTRFEEEQRELVTISQIGKAKNVARCWQQVRVLRDAIKAGTEPADQTVFLDNATPFAQELEDYVQVVFKHRVFLNGGQGDLNPAAYGQVYQSELMDFFRDFCGLPCTTAFACHLGMNMSEEIAATTRFFDLADPKKPNVPREWQPLIMGKSKYRLAGIPDFAFFLETDSAPGHPLKYLARLAPNDKTVGISKPRIQPFVDPRELQFPKNQFYPVFSEALTQYLKTGIPVANPGGK